VTAMAADIIKFSGFELDRDAYQLRRNGESLPLERIPLELLFLFIDRRGQLVTRGEIFERIWGKQVFVDTDNAINTAIRKLRRALDDDPDSPKFIETVPARGYRFVATVSTARQQPSTSSQELLADEVSRDAPPVRYAMSGDIHIAYRVYGTGPRDIVMIPGTLAHLEVFWAIPSYQQLLKRLTAFARVIIFDKRGQGLSDRVVAEQTMEERIDDVRAVMDAAGSRSATIYGWSEGGPMSIMFAATYPERVTALILYGTFASVKDKPWAATREEWEAKLADIEKHWGEGIMLAVNAPSATEDPAMVEWGCRLERASASPGSVVALLRANYEIDVRHILPSVKVPTLVMHRTGDGLVPVASGRYLAEHVPGAIYSEIPGDDHFVTDAETADFIADQIERLVTGSLHRPEPDRVLATVMFTHIVDAIERATTMGEQRWSELLRRFYELLRAELITFRGREIRTVSDGLLVTFDGPARAIRCACSVRDKVTRLGLHLRTGLHTGECDLSGDNLHGIAVDIAAKVASMAASDQVMMSSTVKDLVAGSNLRFVDRGIHTLEAIPGEWHLFRAAD
jgi:pimeloyl-ACP methyl ester carboxylesterase/DNA-binding winged helix-turn-helix (wHTH) protein